MDIEWGIRDGLVYILQARAITTLKMDRSEENRQVAEYIKNSTIKGKEKENMAFQLEKMPYAYRPLDYDYMLTINHQKAKIFGENGLILTSRHFPSQRSDSIGIFSGSQAP